MILKYYKLLSRSNLKLGYIEAVKFNDESQMRVSTLIIIKLSYISNPNYCSEGEHLKLCLSLSSMYDYLTNQFK